jgi:hypothetical protein
VNPKDPRSPKFAYRLDELALLQMATDDILNLERKKQYGVIYDEYTSSEFQKNVSRRRFLIMSNCVETYLGGLQEFDSNDLGFARKTLKGQTMDTLTRKVQRERGKAEEHLVFIPSGFNFKLNGLYWISKDKIFLQCIADSPQIEANTAPMPKAMPTSGEEEGKTASPTGEPTPSGGQAPVPAGETPTETPPTQEAVPVPVQPVPSAEPGAGGVMDTRPEPEQQEKAPTPPSDPGKLQGKARGNRGVAMPLDPGEPATASN